jgi:hypothetical protein
LATSVVFSISATASTAIRQRIPPETAMPSAEFSWRSGKRWALEQARFIDSQAHALPRVFVGVERSKVKC